MNNLLNKIENWTQSGPMGNDKMNAWPYIQMGLGLLSGWASQQNRPEWEDTQSTLNEMFSGTQGLIGNIKERAGDMWDYGEKLVGRGDDLWDKGLEYHDPGSEINQTAYNQFGNNIQDVTTAANRVNTRADNSLGVLGGSGGQNISNQNALNTDMATKLNSTWIYYITGARNQGTQLFGNATSLYGQGNNSFGQSGSLLSQAGGMQSSMDSVLTNAWINHQANEQSMTQDFYGQMANSFFSNMGSDPFGSETPQNPWNININTGTTNG